jgi:hypothetical protein
MMHCWPRRRTRFRPSLDADLNFPLDRVTRIFQQQLFSKNSRVTTTPAARSKSTHGGADANAMPTVGTRSRSSLRAVVSGLSGHSGPPRRGLRVCRRSDRPLCLDHCHATGKVRGFLCRACNLGLAITTTIPALHGRRARTSKRREIGRRRLSGVLHCHNIRPCYARLPLT